LAHSAAPELLPATARGEATRRKILAAAEEEFGAQGFHGTSITDITRTAGVGQGTFYLYFRSKQDVFTELVRHMGRELRHAISTAIENSRPRMAAERVALQAFFAFVMEHRDLYRLVQESMFIDEASYRAYYQDFADAYQQALKASERSGELRPGHAEARAWAIMGAGHFLGLRYCLWGKHGLPDSVLDGVMDFIAHGMAPEKRK
jgi:AcrR family transcriptional regulator